MSTWLVENAEHLRKHQHRSTQKLNLVFVGQVDLIPAETLQYLGNSFLIHDATKEYNELTKEFANIVGFFGGPYTIFTFGFLRWLLVDRVFNGEKVLCYDGDIIHNVAPDELARAFHGITRTATSTCFASISDLDWFRAWRQNLQYFNRDPASFYKRYLPTLQYGFDQFISSPEEYFAKFLIEAHELPHQDIPPSFPYWIVPQPQILPRLFNFVRSQGVEEIPTPMTYRRNNGIDYINEKPIAFWHLQKPFMSQLSALAILADTLKGDRFGAVPPVSFYGNVASEANYLMNDPYHHLGGVPPIPFHFRATAAWLVKQMGERSKSKTAGKDNPFHPAYLYDYYFKNNDFSVLFNNTRWPKNQSWSM